MLFDGRLVCTAYHTGGGRATGADRRFCRSPPCLSGRVYAFPAVWPIFLGSLASFLASF
jgi:hypothetical protein